MHHTSLSKIESASVFLLWFCSELPQDLQSQLRPYLAQPYQSALKVLSCCSSEVPLSVEEIAQQTQLSPASVRQILGVLRSVSSGSLVHSARTHEGMGLSTERPTLTSTLPVSQAQDPSGMQGISETAKETSEEAFFFQKSLDLLSVLGLDGYFKRINPMFTKTLGYSEAEFLAHPFLNFVHPDDHAATLAEMEKLTTGVPTLHFENRYRTQAGSYRWLSWTASPPLDQEVIYCVARDVTQQKQTEAALRESEERLEQRVAERTLELEQINRNLHESELRIRASEQQIRRILDSLFSFVGVMTPDGILIEANRTALEAAALHPADVLGKPFEQTYWWSYSPETQAQLRAAIARAATGEIVRYDAVVRVRDHRLITIDFTLVPIFNEAGEVESLIPSGIDITERKQAETALQESQAQVQRQLAEIETIYQSAPVGLGVLDANLRFVRINQRLAEINGLSVEEHIGRTIEELLPELADVSETLLRPVLETGEPLLNVEIWGETPAQPGVKRVWLESFLPIKEGHRVVGINAVCEEITERKQTEATLRQFNLLIELSYEPIFVWDLDKGIVQWNQGCENLYGYTREEAIGQNSHALLQTLHPLPLSELIDILERDRQWTGELKQMTRTGQQVIVESRQQLMETNGQRLVLETNRNITAYKEAEQRLRESEERLRLGMQVAGFALARVDYAANTVELSPEAAALYGLPPGELIISRDRMQATFPPEDRAELTQLIEQGLDPVGSGWLAHDHRIIWGNGNIKWLTVRKQVFFDHSGGQPIPTYAILVALDITDRKKVEEELRESEDRLRMAIASAQLGTWDWNLLTGELQWDTGCKAMFGLPPEAKVNMEIFYEALHPDDRAHLEKILQLVLDPVSGGVYNTEYRAIGIQDGVERWLRAKGQAYYDASGRPLRLIGTILDVTEQKQAEAQREHLLQQEQAAREAAEYANRMKDEFLAVLSHELRTPLNPILGWAKLLQSPQISLNKLQQGLTTIERNVRQQVQLIEDLLDISRIIRGKMSLNFTTVNLLEPISAAMETVRLAAEAKAIQLQVLLDPSVGLVRGDAGRLQQVIWNLLSNAIKFTPNGGQVTIQLVQVDHQAQIQVRDTGKGIQPDFLPHVFELFRQQDSSTTRSFGGLGLGLAIARQVVEAHGGTITAESPGEGQGATLTVQLPLIPKSDSEAAETFKFQPQGFENLRILVVDDAIDSLELIQVLLEQEGAVVTAVSTATQALQMFTQTHFDLLISDIGMPEMNGYDFIRQVRTLPPQFNRDIPAIALTAYAGGINQTQALRAGFQAHLAKPIDPPHLLEAILRVTSR